MGWSLSSFDEEISSEGCLSWWGDTDDPASVEIGAHLKLPPGAQNLVAHSAQSLQTCDIYASFVIPAPQLDAFLASTHISQTKQVSGSGLANLSPTINAVNWTFNEKMTYLYGSGAGDGGQNLQEIVIEQIRSDTYKVYVVNHLD